MGVAPYKTFTFGGTSSATYGAYITGEGVFNAPERAVEMIDIPGRNGAFALDYGRFNNIEVTYHVGMHDVTDANFAQKVSDFRNFLCSKVGYTRLEDEYNANEYRMAIYKSGLEVEHEGLLNGEFDIVFECKPQRFLTSGETATAVANNGTLSNPTLFDAQPQLQIWGYGGFAVNGEEMEIISEAIGDVVVYETTNTSSPSSFTFEFDDTYANAGDDISSSVINVRYAFKCPTGKTISSVTASGVSDPWSVGGLSSGTATNLYPNLNRKNISFLYGTSQTLTATATLTITLDDNTTHTATITFTIAYDGTHTVVLSASETLPTGFSSATTRGYGVSQLILDSTQSALGSPIYFDLDIGEAYKIENDVAVSVNNAVTIPAELPKLVPGTNTFTYNNTITQFKVVPRWWKV